VTMNQYLEQKPVILHLWSKTIQHCKKN
jgi:hypothetical protein